MSLKNYHAKRDFKKTAEPKGRIVKTQQENLFVIQKHAASHLHYDFRLALNGVLISWAVPKGPCLDPSVKRLAMHVEDHPIEYGSFEGIIPKGQYGGGTVMLWDQGTWLSDDPNPTKAYKNGHMKFHLQGDKLQGQWKLIRIKDNDKTWLLIKGQDEYVKPLKKYDVTLKEPNSVLSQQTLAEIADQHNHVWNSKRGGKKDPALNFELRATPMLKQIKPQLATLVSEPPTGKEWGHEIKLDGYRLLTFKKAKQIDLMTRNNLNWTSKFKSVANAIKQHFPKNCILDGEVVVLDKHQKSSFQSLQNALHLGEDQQLVYYVFDILYYDKYNLKTLPLHQRKAILKELLEGCPGNIQFSEHITGSGKSILKKACQLGLEGIISKALNSEYSERRNKDWLKIKCTQRQEFVVGGYTKPQGNRKHFGSLLIGTYDNNGKLHYNGHVGTGFSEVTLKTLHNTLSTLTSNSNPFTSKPPGISKVTWLKPSLIIEVEFTEWTTDNILRHPSFKGVRRDKKTKEVTMEKAQSLPIKTKSVVSKAARKSKGSIILSHPEKLLYPEDTISKQELADYYLAVASWITPYLKNRPLTLVRSPENYKKTFFQKHLTHTAPAGLFTGPDDNNEEGVIYLKNKTGLLALPQLNVLEIHPWGSTIKNMDYPDMVIFDLDPAPEILWKKVVSTAWLIKNYLAEYKLQSFVKTTGGKGLHVVVPIKSEYDWPAVKNFAHVFVNFLVASNPRDYIGTMSKLERKGKIFIDYLRNQRGATAVAAYSPRARLHAPVSVPIAWDELTNNINDTTYTIRTLPKRLSTLKNDPWADFFKIKQSLKLDKL